MRFPLLLPLLTALLGATALAAGQTPPSASPPTAALAIDTMRRVCLPVLHGGDLQASARAAGFAMKDGQWVLNPDRDSSIVLYPPDSASPHVCNVSITAPFADASALKKAVDNWARSQTPALSPVSLAPAAGSTWTSSLWSAGNESVALGQEQATSPSASTQSNLVLTLGAS
jgi:hypothetical protein